MAVRTGSISGTTSHHHRNRNAAAASWAYTWVRETEKIVANNENADAKCDHGVKHANCKICNPILDPVKIPPKDPGSN